MRDFSDLASFGMHLVSLEMKVQRVAEKALERAAKVIEQTAKDELGHYQPAKGPYGAWAQLSEGTIAHHGLMGIGDSPLLVTGELYASVEREVVGGEAVIGSKMDIAAYQEFGTNTIPPRPFMGPAAFTTREQVERIFGRSMLDVLTGGNSLIDYEINE